MEEEVKTDSFWVLEGSGRKKIFYRGGLAIQVARQLLLKYTKKGEMVLDVFCGGGTVIFECLGMGRIPIGIDINEKIVGLVNKEVKRRFYGQKADYLVYEGDSRLEKTYVGVRRFLEKRGKKGADLVVLHPPYFQAISYCQKSGDLSGLKNVSLFYKEFGRVVDNVLRFLKKEGYLVLVVGDVRMEGRLEMLGFCLANVIKKKGLTLRSIVVKNVGKSLGKRGRRGVLKYRSRVGDYYSLSHEYVFVFKKREKF